MSRKERNVKKQKIEDNDRVVANMNVDGIPFSSMPRIGSHGDKKENSNHRNSSYNQVNGENDDSLAKLSKKELRRITFSATLAGVLIGSIFLIIFFLFIMFCIFIWL